MLQRAVGMTLTLLAPAFADHAPIPAAHTCDGDGIAPALGWSGAPAHTAAYALIVDDPDAPDPAAPKRTFVHWVVWNIPASVTELADGGALPDGAHEGRNDAGGTGYTGPCPPIGRHRYFFKLYALDAPLAGLGRGATKADLERAMKGHVIAQAQVVGTYEAGGAGRRR